LIEAEFQIKNKTTMTRQITKVAVVGSGVMGSAIAAHLANAIETSWNEKLLPRALARG